MIAFPHDHTAADWREAAAQEFNRWLETGNVSHLKRCWDAERQAHRMEAPAIVAVEDQP